MALLKRFVKGVRAPFSKGLTMLRTLIIICLMAVSASSWAFPTQVEWYVNGATGTNAASAGASCDLFVAQNRRYEPNAGYNGSVTGSGDPAGGTFCTLTAPGYTHDYPMLGAQKGTCPANSTLANGQCTCSADTVESNGQCIASQCSTTKGKTSIVNRTVGFVRSTDENDYAVVGPVTKSIPGRLICVNGCAAEIQPVNTSTPGAGAYRSQVPNAAGLYRLSLDLPVTENGTSCAAGAEGSATEKAPQNPLTPAPTCPGYVGEVNGRLGCYGTAEKPVVTVPADRPVSPPESGNPAAGPKPVSGEGSGTGGAGRTPVGGTGDNNGGPSSAVTAGRPSGTASAPAAGEEQMNCGAPGQPKCRIDESGTGDGKTAFDSAKSELTDNEAATKNAINGAANITAPTWSFSFQLPTGCTPYQTGIRGFVMNPCAYQSTIHDLMSMIWAAVTAFCIIGMVGRTIRES